MEGKSENKPTELVPAIDEDEEINKEYQELAKDYDESCKEMEILAKRLKKDFQTCTDKMETTAHFLKSMKEEDLLDYEIPLYARLPIVKYITGYNKPSLKKIIEDELKTLVNARTQLEGKISIVEKEKRKGSRRIELLFNLEGKKLEQMNEAESAKARVQKRKSRLDAEYDGLNAEYGECPKTSKQQKRLLSLDKRRRALRVEISNYDVIIDSADSSIKQVQNLRKAYELLSDEGITLSLKGTKILEQGLKNSHTALEKMVHGKIALAGLVQTAYESSRRFIVIREDMNYFLEKLIIATAKLPEIIKVCDQPFYREEILADSKKLLADGKKVFDKRPDDSDVIDATPESQKKIEYKK